MSYVNAKRGKKSTTTLLDASSHYLNREIMMKNKKSLAERALHFINTW